MESSDYYGYVYITINLINGHKYIGQHHWEKTGIDPYYYGSGKLLLKAIKKYGKENFRVHVLQWCKNQWDLDAREKAWILMYDALKSTNFYNLVPGGNGLGAGEDHPCHGKHYKRTEETKQKIREHHADQSGEKNGMYGKQHTEEAKQKMRENRPDQSGENNPMWGKQHTEEAKQKMREHHASVDISGENNPFYGHQHTEETRRKISLTNAKFTENQVLEILELRKQGFKYRELAEKFGVTRMTISKICRGNTYTLITRHTT